MDALLQSAAGAGATAQALVVTVGGLAGVFATLFAFWALISLAERLTSRSARRAARRSDRGAARP